MGTDGGSDFRVDEGLKLDFPALGEASAGGFKSGVVGPGMAHQLAGTIGEIFDHFLEDSGVHVAGDGDAEEVVGRLELVGAEATAKNRGRDTGKGGEEALDLITFRQITFWRGLPGGLFIGAILARLIERFLEGLADAGDAAGRGSVEKSFHDFWMHVGVFVGVNVAGCDADIADALDLSAKFGFDIDAADEAGRNTGDYIEKAFGQIAAFGYERGDFFRRGDGAAAGKNEVAAHVETGNFAGLGDGVVKGLGVGHQSGAGEDSFAEGLDDAVIDADGETEVVRIDDERFHEAKAG